MTAFDDEDNTVPYMDNQRMLKVIFDEIVAVRRELKEEDQKLSEKIDSLTLEVKTISSDLKGLRLQVHQNQTTFIQNQQDLDHRVTVLEAV